MPPTMIHEHPVKPAIAGFPGVQPWRSTPAADLAASDPSNFDGRSGRLKWIAARPTKVVGFGPGSGPAPRQCFRRFVMQRSRSLPLILTLALFATFAACSRDPNLRKQKFFASGQSYFAQGKYPEAAIQFSNAIDIDPRFAEAHYQLAQADLKLRNGIRHTRNSAARVELQPENDPAHIDLANLLVSGHDFKHAQEQIDLLLAKSTRKPAGSFGDCQSPERPGQPEWRARGNQKSHRPRARAVCVVPELGAARGARQPAPSRRGQLQPCDRTESRLRGRAPGARHSRRHAQPAG